jgi:peptidoglycan hydrolase CwlO-like protein
MESNSPGSKLNEAKAEVFDLIVQLEKLQAQCKQLQAMIQEKSKSILSVGKERDV